MGGNHAFLLLLNPKPKNLIIVNHSLVSTRASLSQKEVGNSVPDS